MTMLFTFEKILFLFLYYSHFVKNLEGCKNPEASRDLEASRDDLLFVEFQRNYPISIF